MEKLMFLDACIRGGESRTLKIAEPLLKELEKRYEIERVDINALGWKPIDRETCLKRNSGEFDEEVLAYAKRLAAADRIVIAAPFWDMSFPAALKTFLELMSINEVAFCYTDTGLAGCCKAEKMLYITTRGSEIATGDVLEQATPYLKALGWLWGIHQVECVDAKGLDMYGPEIVEERVCQAIEEGLKLCESF